MDSELLGRIDADPEARTLGRSAFIQSAVQLYLRAKERHKVEENLARAYGGEADPLLAEIEDLVDGQSWPMD